MKWSFYTMYRFSDFIKFIHEEKNIIISYISIRRLYSDMVDIERGEYSVTFYIIDNIPKQLTLF